MFLIVGASAILTRGLILTGPRSASEFSQFDIGVQMLENQEFSNHVNVDRTSNRGVVGQRDVRLHGVFWTLVTRLAICGVKLQQSQNECKAGDFRLRGYTHSARPMIVP